MSKRITKAFADYQAAITPKAVKHALKALGRRGLIKAANIRAGAALTLRAALEKEIAR